MPQFNTVVTQWSEKQQLFFYWYVNPNKGRNGIPKTQREWAIANDTHPNSASNWVKQPGFQEEAIRFRREMLLQDLPEIYLALGKKAKAGSFPHIKLALELAGEYSEEKNININDRRSEIVDMIDGSLDARIEALKKQAGINN